jgi:hypothetical protein
MTIKVNGLTSVESKLTFLAEGVQQPVNYFGVEPPEGEPALFPREHIPVTIFDGREIQNEFDLDVNGFMLLHDPINNVDNFYDDKQVKNYYYPSLESLVKKVTGAQLAVVFDHTYRSGGEARENLPNINPVVLEAHNDYTDDSGPERVKQMTEECAPHLDVGRLMQGRYGIYNVWRSINATVEEKPLTLCDMSSLRAEDFVPCILKWPHRNGYVNVMRYNTRQKWFYFDKMKQEEALVFKCFDSRECNHLRYTAHSAFIDPNTVEDCRTRESIESRIIVYY